MQNKVRILIYGAGVIGSIYAVSFSQAGYDVSIYARSQRLTALKQNGLLYNENNETKVANVSIIDNLSTEDSFDFVFVTVRYEQMSNTLEELSKNNSKNIVPMVNTPNGYTQWEAIVGKNRLIPCFAGAGGSIKNDVLYFRFTPSIIQSTTFGEINGQKTVRIQELANVFKKSNIRYSICSNMDAWQKPIYQLSQH